MLLSYAEKKSNKLLNHMEVTMSNILQSGEVIKLAIAKEQESHNLYQQFHQKTTNEEVKAVLKDLMEKKLKHQQSYQCILEDCEQNQTHNTIKDEEYHGYMQEFIASTKKSVPISDLDDLEQMLNHAIEHEKNSLAFYISLKDYALRNAHNTLKTIHDNHVEHIDSISNLCIG